MELRGPEDLVGVGVADAAEERLVLKQVPDLAPLRRGALDELGLGPVERPGVGSDVHVARRVYPDVHLAHPDVVAVAELRPTLELQAQARVLRGLRAGRLEREDPRQHRVHRHHQAVEGEHQEFPVMGHRAERAAHEQLVDRSKRTEHDRIPDADGHDLLPHERVGDALLHDPELGPLRHQSGTAASQRGSGRSKWRAAQASVVFSWRRWTERIRGRPLTGPRHARSAKYPAMPAIDASRAPDRNGSTRSYSATTRSGSMPPSIAIVWANAATSNSTGPAQAKFQSNSRSSLP